jgi:hypothetical protein
MTVSHNLTRDNEALYHVPPPRMLNDIKEYLRINHEIHKSQIY